MLRTDTSKHLLSDGDTENAAAALAAAAANLQAIERELSAAEDRIWQPHWSKSDPLAERLRRVGVTDATAKTLICLIEGWDAFCRGEPMPAETNTLLDQQEQAERSADRQLAVILKSRSIGTSMAAKMGARMGTRLRSKRSRRFDQ
jgi:dihydroxyacetone kinase-like predicted kinase